jgi:hypothetical protein
MSLIPPPWLREIVRLTAPAVHQQIQVVLEAYAREPAWSCPFVSPTLECGDCGTRVMLQESRTRPLRCEWWEVISCRHERGHALCEPIYQPHSRRRCSAASRAIARPALPWIFEGTS